jgi:hypothetical protein
MARLLDFIIFGVPRSGTRMRIPRAFSSAASATILRFVSDTPETSIAREALIQLSQPPIGWHPVKR